MLNVILYAFSVLRVFELILTGHNSFVLLECGRKLDFELTSLSFTWFWAVCPKRGPLPGASPTVWGKEKFNNIGNNCKTNNNYYKIKNNNNNINGINTTPWWALHCMILYFEDDQGTKKSIHVVLVCKCKFSFLLIPLLIVSIGIKQEAARPHWL